MNKSYRVLFIGVIVLATILRFFQLGSNPPSLDWDEASIGYNAYSILHTGRDEYGNFLPLSFRSFDDYKPPVYIYLTVPSIAIFGLDEFAVRFPAAFIGVLAVGVVYFLTRELLRKWDEKVREYISLTAAVFLAISPWHVQFSRAAFEGNVGMFFLVLSLLCFFRAFQRSIFYIGFAVSIILSMYSYHSFRLLDPVILIALVGLFRKQLLSQKKVVLTTIIFIILAVIPIYNSFIQNDQTGARLSMVTIFSDPATQKLSAVRVAEAKQQHDLLNEILYNRRIIFIPQMISGYFSHFVFQFLFMTGDGGVQHHAYHMGMLYLWDLPFILLGIYFLIKKRDRRILLLFLIFLLAPLPASITTGTPHPVRAIAMIPAFQIFSATGCVLLCSYLLKKTALRRVGIGVILLFLLGNFGYYLHSYYSDTPVHYGYFWQYGNKQAIQYAKQHENEYDHIRMTYAYDQPYIYYLFYNKIDPSWYQTHWDTTGYGTIDRFYRKIGKYEFMNITPKQFTDTKTLLIGTPSEIPQGIGTLKSTINYLDGTTAYRIVSL